LSESSQRGERVGVEVCGRDVGRGVGGGRGLRTSSTDSSESVAEEATAETLMAKSILAVVTRGRKLSPTTQGNVASSFCVTSEVSALALASAWGGVI
jgi:hypothetical protein